MEWSKIQKQSKGNRKSPETGNYESPFCRRRSPLSTSTANENDAIEASECLPVDIPSSELSPSLSDGWIQICGSDCAKQSKTQNCVSSDGPLSLENGYQLWTPTRCHHRRLVNSASFSGFGVSHRLVCEHQKTSVNNQELINYCSLTPEVQLVPSIAKPFLKKRISFRRPKKVIKDLFVHKKHSCEKTASPCKSCRQRGATSKRTKKFSRRRDQTRPCQKEDSLSDSSSERCTNVCEDAASLKSFGSQAGCGEIFADEEYVVSLERTVKPETYRNAPESPKQSSVKSTFHGGNEQLASPGQTEVLDLFGMWETINKTIIVGQSSKQESNTSLTSISPSSNKTTSLLEDFLDRTSDSKTSGMHPNMVTPKSELHRSTSDEGYCDSSGYNTRQSVSPVYSSKIPRDTYSGDALYELFFDSRENETTPIFDNDIDPTCEIIGLPSPDLPLSMYSFHIGSEENLAPPLAVDLINHDFLQSNWAGKDCLLKLCDTEISLAMGLVNWLKHRSLKGNQEELTSPEIIPCDNGDQCQEDKIRTKDFTNVPSNAVLKPGYGQSNSIDLNLSNQCQVVAGHLSVESIKQNGILPSVTTPETQPMTNRVCFRIFNVNSPSTPTKDLVSPMGRSPGSGSSSLFVLAINKESLCDSCKASLKHGAKELHLCQSCTAFVESTKSSELWTGASLYQPQTAGSSQSLEGGLLPSPSSSYGVASDISILSLVEQCANQMSSLKINKNLRLSDYGRRAATEPTTDDLLKKHRSRKYERSTHKKHKSTASLPAGHESLHHVVHCSSLLKGNSGEVSQALRPTSLPLPHTASITVEEKPGERVRQDRTGIKEGLLDNMIHQEKKVERRQRVKK